MYMYTYMYKHQAVFKAVLKIALCLNLLAVCVVDYRLKPFKSCLSVFRSRWLELCRSVQNVTYSYVWFSRKQTVKNHWLSAGTLYICALSCSQVYIACDLNM